MNYKSMSFPFRLNNLGGVATVEEGSTNHLEENITQILTTLRGERPMLPNYGCDIDFSIFENIETPLYNILVTELIQSVTSQEPNVVIAKEDVYITSEGNNVNIAFKYTFKVDGSSHNYQLQL